tara:strand:- start:1599 stop:2948 length:1350 start_codon:yes stop_codon:yes gene_type:complete
MTETKKIKFNKKIKRKSRHHRNKIKFILKKTKKKHKLLGGSNMPTHSSTGRSIDVTPYFEDSNDFKIEYAIFLDKIVSKVGWEVPEKRLFILSKDSDDDIQDSTDDSENKDIFFPLVEYCLCYYKIDPTKKNKIKIDSHLKKLKLYRFKTKPMIIENKITFLYKVGRFDDVMQSGNNTTRTYNLKYNNKANAEAFLDKLNKAYDATFNPTIDTFLQLIQGAKSEDASNNEYDKTINDLETSAAANSAAELADKQASNKNNRAIALGASYVGFFASLELFRNTANIMPISAVIASLAAGVAMQITTISENDILVKQSYNRVHNLIKYIIEPLQQLESMNENRGSIMKINYIEIIVYLLMLLRKCKAWKKRTTDKKGVKDPKKYIAIFLTVYPSIYNNKIINICNKLEETIVLMSQILSIHVNINVLKLDEKIDTLLKKQNCSDNTPENNN